MKNVRARISMALDRGLNAGDGRATVFFRADDIGVPSSMFTSMVELFIRLRIPLCLAVVPGWLTISRVEYLMRTTGSSELFCWHQHGWLHKNHEISGKKQEFGDIRRREYLHQDIRKGMEKLDNLLGENWYSVFTPPWNRCGQKTLKILQELGFTAVSRSRGAHPPAPANLQDYQVNVDLHTRKEMTPETGMENLLSEIERSAASGTIGIMLHHQRMNDGALSFLASLLEIIQKEGRIETRHFANLR